MARQRVNITLKEEYASALDEWRNKQPVPPNRTDVVYKAIDLFLEEQGEDPVDDID